jgi:hypothetical protein
LTLSTVAERAPGEATFGFKGTAGLSLAVDRAPGEATFGFKGTAGLSLAVAEAYLSAHFIQHRRMLATHADIAGRRRPMMSSSSLQAPDGMVCFGKTLNFETICKMPVNTATLRLSGQTLS